MNDNEVAANDVGDDERGENIKEDEDERGEYIKEDEDERGEYLKEDLSCFIFVIIYFVSDCHRTKSFVTRKEDINIE